MFRYYDFSWLKKRDLATQAPHIEFRQFVHLRQLRRRHEIDWQVGAFGDLGDVRNLRQTGYE